VTLDSIARWIVRSQPYLPGLGWFVATFYGLFAALCLLGGWWPGVALFAAGGAASWWCVRRMQGCARELERIVGEQARGGGSL
jgi:hypothetical protein